MDPSPPEPLLTIGVPVYNGGSTLRSALTALLAQTYSDFRLVIADNASTDETAAIALEFATADPRVSIVRRPRLLPATENFGLLAAAARTPFFMFAAADDHWYPRFVEVVLGALVARPEASLAISQVEMIERDGARRLSNGTFAIGGEPAARLRHYLRRPGDGSRFYGIHRTAPLRAGFRASSQPMVAFDWLVMIPGLLAGEHIEVGEVLMARSSTPIERYRDWVVRLESNPIGRAIPNLRMARALMALLPRQLRRPLAPVVALMCISSMRNSPYRPVRGLHHAIASFNHAIRHSGRSPSTAET